MEIERRWKIAGFPDNLPLLRKAHMRQGYIATAPVVRIRTDGTRCVLCFKGKGTLAREEIETDLDPDTFRRLEAFIGKPLVSKDYRVYALPEDVYKRQVQNGRGRFHDHRVGKTQRLFAQFFGAERLLNAEGLGVGNAILIAQLVKISFAHQLVP